MTRAEMEKMAGMSANGQNVYEFALKFAKSYHKAKIESVSVEDISNMFPKTNNACYVACNAIKTFKSELLK